MAKHILITGATGQLGTLVVNHLLTKVPASDVSVLVRDEKKAQPLKEKGVDVRIGDYFNPETLEKAFTGIDRLLFISSSDFNDRIGQHRNVVDAAKKAGVKHLLYTGVTLRNIEESPLKPLLHDHFLTEEYIQASGIPYTFLQNGLYAEGIPMFLGEKAVESGIYFPAGEGKVAMGTRADMAEAIAHIVAGEGHENKAYPLTSTQAHSFAEIAGFLSELSGKSVSYTNPSAETFEGALKQMGLPEGIVLMSTLFAAGMKNNDFAETSPVLEQFLGRRQTDMKAFLKAAYQL